MHGKPIGDTPLISHSNSKKCSPSSSSSSSSSFSSLEIGLSEYRRKAREHWQVQQFYAATRGLNGQPTDLYQNERMYGQTIGGRMKMRMMRLWIWMTLWTKTDDYNKRTYNKRYVVSMIIILIATIALVYWYYRSPSLARELTP